MPELVTKNKQTQHIYINRKIWAEGGQQCQFRRRGQAPLRNLVKSIECKDFLKARADGADTTDSGRKFQTFITRWEKEYRFKSLLKCLTTSAQECPLVLEFFKFKIFSRINIKETMQ